VREALLPLVQLADALSASIQSYDQKIEELGRETNFSLRYVGV
jgi:hypothetical protein